MMNKNYELIQKIIKDGKYKVADSDEGQIVIRYQLNSIHVCPSKGDDQFVSVMLPNFAVVTEDNFSDVVMRCHKLNEQMKLAKLYTVSDVIVATAEFFFLGEEDLAYQFKIALNSVIAAKVGYEKLEK